MNNKSIHNGIKDIQKITLTEQERAVIFSRLDTYANAHVPHPIRSPFYTYFTFRFATAALAIVFLVGGTSVFASAQALPGDVLYSIKVRVSEPLKIAIAVTPEAKELRQVSRVEERLREVEVLAVQGRLATSTETEIKMAVDIEVRKLKRKLSEKNRDDLEVKVSAHADILNSIQKRSQKEDDDGVDTDPVVTTNTSSARNEASFNEKKNRVKKTIDDTREKIKKNRAGEDRTSLTFEQAIFDDASTTIRNASVRLEKAKAKHTLQDEHGAEALIKASEKSAKKASIYVDRAIELSKVKGRKK